MMYHFVGLDAALKSISFEDFCGQLDYLGRTYPPDEVALTFDHGTIDHIETVAPELERRGLRGIFFILTMVPEELRVPSIDKQRFLEADYRLELARMLCKELYIDYAPEQAQDYLAKYDFYSLEERFLRYLRDKVIPPRVFDSVIGTMFEKAFGDERAFCMRRYLGWHHIYQLHKRGHVIGSHSHYHYGDKTDYKRSLELINGVLGEKPRLISYPNGFKRITDEELRALEVETAYISSEPGVHPFRAGRADCNQFAMN